MFLALCLVLFAFMAYWASGRNPVGLVTPWLLYSSIAGSLLTLRYIVWHLRKARLPQ
ncbi:MAG: hypothetical protein AAB036_05885 [Elusimicrobiota bacterium]